MTLSDSWADKQATVTRVGAAEAVLRELRSAIEGGELAVGTRLPSEAALATRFGVSRSVVREALRSTTALGLTETHTGKGTFVLSDAAPTNAVFGKHSAASLREARPHIEVPAAALAAQRRTPEQLESLQALLRAMIDEDDPEQWVRHDAEFHLQIATASGNDVFTAVLTEIREALSRQSEMVNLLRDRQQRSNVEHAEILDAIESGSGEAASDAMSRHLTHVQVALDALRG